MPVSRSFPIALVGASILALAATPSPGQQDQEPTMTDRPTLFVYSDYV